MDDLVVVKTFPSRIEAEIVKGKLEANNIKAMISADDAGGMYPFPLSPNSKGVELFVNKKNFDSAKKLLD